MTDDAGERSFALVDPATGGLSTVGVAPATGDVMALLDAARQRIYYDVWTPTSDEGVYVLDIASGESTALVVRRDVKEAGGRTILTSTPSGRFVVSSYCDLTSCDVDIIDASKDVARRVGTRFKVVIATDTHLFGRDQAGATWGFLSLTDETFTPLSEEMGQVSAAHVVEGGQVVFDSLVEGKYRVLGATPDGKTRVVTEQPADPDPAFRLMVEQPPRSDWVLVSPAVSVWELREQGKGEVSALSIRDGSIIPGVFKPR